LRAGLAILTATGSAFFPIGDGGQAMDKFDHDKLDVYRTAIDFVAVADDVVEHLPRGRGYLAEQLHRAATSVPLNIAEGAGEFAADEKARFYRMAKRSATECAAIFDVCKRLKVIEEPTYSAGRELLLRIVAMLIKMAQRTSS
jgi:four helix bundle protein